MRAGEAGAHAIVNRRAEPVVPVLEKILGGKAQVDRIVEVALAENLNDDIDLLKTNGVIAAYSSDAIAQPIIPFSRMLQKKLTLRFIYVYEMTIADRQKAIVDISRLMTEGLLKHQIAGVFPPDAVAAAHERQE